MLRMITRFGILCLLITSIMHSCVSPNSTFDGLPPGIWQGTLLLDRLPSVVYGDDRDITKTFNLDGELNFNFEVIYNEDGTFYIEFINGEERIKVEDIYFGRDLSTAKDTVKIDFLVYDTQINTIYEEGIMEGEWTVNYKDGYRIPFKAVHGIKERVNRIGKGTPQDFSGKWEATFDQGKEGEFKAIGLFEQKNDIVTGTFLTETGDFRYLEGKVLDNKMYLSAFDGAHAFYFIGKKLENGEIDGIFRSGSQYTVDWKAIKNESFQLNDPTTINKIVDPYVDFTFNNTNGKPVSIKDPIYHDKIKIIQIMGTWCPNCMDETQFLLDYFEKNPDNDVQIFSIGFERYNEVEKSIEALTRFKSKLNINHEVLYGGSYNKNEAIKKLPFLDRVVAYPTMIITDKSNKIIHIHTGFSGPSTPEYASFYSQFASLLQSAKK